MGVTSIFLVLFIASLTGIILEVREVAHPAKSKKANTQTIFTLSLIKNQIQDLVQKILK